MPKGLFSFLPVRKVKIMKKRDSKKRLMLKRVFDFLKSDYYMFAPLVSSQSSPFITSSTGVEANGTFKGKHKNSVGGLKDYMKSDCYMYAPLLLNEPRLPAAVCPAPSRPGAVSFPESIADTRRQRDTTKIVTEETKDPGQKIKSIRIRDQHVDGYHYTRSAVINHTLLQRETVKHVIQQNIRPSSAEGDEKKEKRGGKRVKINGSNAGKTKKKKRVAGK